MTPRRLALAALAVLAVAALLVAIGRWERSRRAGEQVDGMRTVVAAVGPLDNDTLKAFRFLSEFQCLLYERQRNPVALELCFDPDGRVVEAIDRRGDEPRIFSLRDDPTRATIRVDRGLVDRLLIRTGVPRSLLEQATG
jgi:hypothetical protein